MDYNLVAEKIIFITVEPCGAPPGGWNKFEIFATIVELSLETSEKILPSLLQSMVKLAECLLGSTPKTDLRAIEEHKHHQLLSILALKGGSDTASILSEDSTFSSSTGCQSDIQSPKQIFHGCESELNDVVTNLLQDGRRVAILGPGGIGKTSFAKAVMHHADLVARFPDRYFVSCESSQSAGELMAAVASALGLKFTGKLTAKLSQSIFKCLSSKKSCLLVPDNFETLWEPREMRAKVEEFLTLLGDLRKVALLMTMRGQERLLKIRWTRPFVQPLRPLPAAAAR
ncbi:hypothetical protein B0H14DRAFT_3698892 [Mycena olivaceomarginata]|nr:hypothetical protein B0H14DRAFT_3698892 [Mycena olivaceomarginata]